MIAQIAIESELLLLHNDRDFEAMAAVVPLNFLDPKLWQGTGIHSYQVGTKESFVLPSNYVNYLANMMIGSFA